MRDTWSIHINATRTYSAIVFPGSLPLVASFITWRFNNKQKINEKQSSHENLSFDSEKSNQEKKISHRH
jgi:hypothetical protein